MCVTFLLTLGIKGLSNTNQTDADDVNMSRSRDKTNISFTKVLMVTILIRMVSYLDGRLPIKLHDRLTTRSCKIM